MKNDIKLYKPEFSAGKIVIGDEDRGLPFSLGNASIIYQRVVFMSDWSRESGMH